MLMKRVRRGCTFTHAAAGPVHGLSPKHSFDDSNNAEDQTRHDETAVQAYRHLAASAHQEDGRTSSYFRCPWLAYDGLFLLGGRFKPVDQG